MIYFKLLKYFFNIFRKKGNTCVETFFDIEKINISSNIAFQKMEYKIFL